MNALNGAGNEHDLLVSAIRDALRNDAGAKKFGLTPIENEIRQMHGGWNVPIASGVVTGSAYDLSRAIDHVQEMVEQSTGLFVTLMLDPFAEPDTPSTR